MGAYHRPPRRRRRHTAAVDAFEVARRFGETYSGIDVVPQMRELVSRWKTADAVEREQLFRGDPVASLLSPDIEIDVRLGPNPGRARGWNAVIELHAEWYTFWERYVFVNDGYRDLGGGVVFNRVQVRGEARDGMSLDMTSYQLLGVRDGLIVRWSSPIR